MARKLAAGNWKMNGLTADLAQIADLAPRATADGPGVLICPPATLISAMAGAADGTALRIGGQDCHAAEAGAHTGDISAQMLADAGASHVILGHSERRADHGESDADVAAKVTAAWAAGLTAIVCIGESHAQYEAGETVGVVERQLDGSLPDGITGENTVIAYEPIWAIGTGLVPTTEEIGAVHAAIRARLAARFGSDTAKAVSILYGGSVKPGNAAEIFGVENVDGALVGGASLKAADFGPIIDALAAAG